MSDLNHYTRRILEIILKTVTWHGEQCPPDVYAASLFIEQHGKLCRSIQLFY